MPVLNQKFGVALDDAFRRSFDYGNSQNVTSAFKDKTAVLWMTSFDFSPRKVPMQDWEKAYQHEGHAKFIDIAQLYGWGALNNFWYFYNDSINASAPTDSDSMLVQLCKSAGADVRPLWHFWGVPPVNSSSVATQVSTLGMTPSAEIYDLLVHYKSLLPANNAAYQAWATVWYGKQPSITGNGVEREHARQWSTTLLNGTDTQMRFPTEIYDGAAYTAVAARVQEILDLYYPTGRPPSNNSRLSNLSPSLGTLSPDFTGTTLGYSDVVPYTATTMTVTPVASDDTASITVNGVSVASGSASGPINVSAASSVINIVLVSSDTTTTTTYTVTVTHSPPSSIASLSDLTSSTGTLSPVFASGTTGYAATVPFSTTSMTVTPTASAGAAVTVNGNNVVSGTASGPIALNVGSNVITTTVLSESHTVTKTYTLTVQRTANSQLANLLLSAGVLSPAFSSTTLSYTDVVSFSTTSLTVTPTASDPAAHITVNGTTVNSGSSTAPIALAVGSNAITTVVVSQDSASTTTYTLAVTRSAPGSRWWDGGTATIATNGDGASAGGSGTWDTTIQNWDQGSGLPHAAWDNGDDDTAVFAGTAGTVTLGAAVSASGLRFDSANYSITGGTLTLTSGGSIAANANATIASAITGSTGLSKTGAGTLTLGVANSYTGGTVLNGGGIVAGTAGVAGSGNNALGTGTITFTGSASLTPGYNIAPSIANGVTVNPSVTASFLNGNQYQSMTINGALAGSGTVVLNTGLGGAAGYLSFASVSNTFTGTLTINNTGNGNGLLTVNSLPDSANPIRFSSSSNAGIFSLGSGANAPLVLNSRQIEIYGTLGATIDNSNGNAANTITINPALSVTTAGAKTLTLQGSNTGNNAFNGLIANGTVGAGAVISLTKAGNGTWILPNNNTFTGGVTVNGGTLTLSGTNQYTGATALSAGSIIFSSIKNYNTASSLGKPASGDIAFSRYGSPANQSLIYTGNGDSTNRTILLDGYTISDAAGASIINNGTGALTFTASTFNTFGATASRRVTLVLDGTYTAAANQIQGVIQNYNSAVADNLLLTKNGASTWTLSGANTYTGATTVNGGTLALGAGGGILGSATAGSAVTVNSTLAVLQSASGNSNTIGTAGQTTASTLSLAAGSALNMADGFTTTLNMTGTATLALVSGVSPALTFNIDSANNTSDKLAITGAATVGNGKAVINFVPIAAPSAGTNTYTLITAASGLGTSNFTLGTTNYNIGGTLYSASLSTSTATAEILSFVSGGAIPTTAYWTGANDASWKTTDGTTFVTNFTNDAAGTFNTLKVPGTISTVTMTANSTTNLSTTLDQAFSIAGLVFSGTGTSNTAGSTIDSGTGGAASTLTLSSGGITVNAGSGANAISAPVILGAAQSWTNSSINTLTVSGGIDNGANLLMVTGTGDTTLSGNLGSGANKTGGLTKSGNGTLTLSSNTNGYTGATTISAGTLKAGSSTAFNTTSALVATAGTLDLNGFNVGFLSSTGGASANTITNSATGSITNTLTIGTGTGTNYLAAAGLAPLITDGSNGNKTAIAAYNNLGALLTTNVNNTFSGGLALLGNNSGLQAGQTRLQAATGATYTTTAGVTTVTKGPYGTGAIILGSNATDQVTIYFNTTNVTLANSIVVNSAVGTDVNGTIRVDNTGNAIVGAVQLNNSGITIDSYTAGSLTISGQISSIGGSATGVTVQNAVYTGTARNLATNLTLANVGPANSYTGDTVVNYAQGIITLGANNQIPNGSGKGNLAITLGTFNMASFSDTINGLSGAGTVDGVSGTPTLIVGDNNATSSFTGVIKNTAGTLALTKIGSGIQTLSGANTYTGTTTLSGGVLSTGTAGILANSAVASSIGKSTNSAASLVLDGGTLRYANTGVAQSTDRLFTLTNNGGTLDASGTNAITFAGNGAGAANAIAYTGTSTRTLALTGTGTGTLAPILADNTGATALTKSGNGTWTLTGVNTYSGNTAIDAGTLKLNAAGSIANSPSITLASGATFDVSTLTTALTFGAGQTLKSSATGAAATATLTTVSTKNLTLSAGGLAFTAYGGANGNSATNAPLTVTGAGQLKMNGAPVTVTTSSLLAAGTYVLVAANGSATVTGTPGALTINGSGASNTGSLAITGGQLVLTVNSGPGPVDHFTISAISSPQTVGAPINGITLTAQDASNNTATGFTGTVTFGGTGGFTGTSASFVSGVLSGVSVMPMVTGGNLTFIVTDGAGHTGSTTIAAVQPGAVNSFVFSSIASPQTVGRPITGITITAKDASYNTATSFTGTVSFGGTGGFTGTSASFVSGVLNGVSVMPTVTGSNLTLTVSDGASHTGSTTIATIQTQYAAWSGGAGFGADANGDGVANGLAWVLGAANPNENAISLLPTLSTSGGNMTFTFKRSQASISTDTAVIIEVGTSLGTWPANYIVGAYTAGSSAGVTVSKNTPNAGTDTVTLSVAQAPDAQKFARLKVVQTP